MKLYYRSAAYEAAWAQVWTVKAGKVTDFREYVDTAAVSRAYTAVQTS
jgi:ketosteroid isomerase-like protein